MVTDTFEGQFNSDHYARQLSGFVVSILLCLLFSLYFAAEYFTASAGHAEISLKDKINVNIAPVASLARLPGIGPARAQAIVAYRTAAATGENKPVFDSAADLQHVKGIGPKTVRSISGWLEFQ